jgi:hypothetical protein
MLALHLIPRKLDKFKKKIQEFNIRETRQQIGFRRFLVWDSRILVWISPFTV